MSRPLPMIFDTSNILFEDRMSAYKNILGLCKPDEVSDKIAKYVAQNVNSSGWQAVWRSTPKSSGHNQPFDVLVEVLNVNAAKLMAEVHICEPVVTDSLNVLDMDHVNMYLQSQKNAVPLIELCPVYDESGQCDDTALAVEHVRFFYENIWREWDEDEDGDYSYVARYLEARLQLYHDIKEGNLPKDLVNRYGETCNQYRQKLAELKQLQEQMAAKELDQELDEVDVLRCAQMFEFCESLAHSLQIIENPQMRYLLATVTPKMARGIEPRGNRTEEDDPITYIVAPKLQAGMVKFFQDDTVVAHFPCLGKALNSYYIGDTIVVFPGKYNLDGVYELVDSVHITGKGNCSEIIVCCSENDDIPLQCSAGDISIKNVTFEQENDNNGIVLIKSGRVTFDNCEMKCVANGVTVESAGEMVMRECKLHGAKSIGITVSHGASVHLQSNNLFDNGKNSTASLSLSPTGAILLEAHSDCKKPKAILTDNYITNNHCYGICIKKDSKLFSETKAELHEWGQY
ncbi:PREDICTED: SHC SH2 domain-binding protein 1-like isoform X2 [Acropora digitifera]|uniref:SHC SH2 domain-binding protein 1-like isoform X2 n=1 Tax=Acropora digitifera TaxID=70779 RepID=UPI00077AF6B3|nr:PREDICTED: SHC SH2 domain-binding protein 1-like isoform X2 [Acropora digitifera]